MVKAKRKDMLRRHIRSEHENVRYDFFLIIIGMQICIMYNVLKKLFKLLYQPRDLDEMSMSALALAGVPD
jgi:hypothetical protein